MIKRSKLNFWCFLIFFSSTYKTVLSFSVRDGSTSLFSPSPQRDNSQLEKRQHLAGLILQLSHSATQLLMQFCTKRGFFSDEYFFVCLCVILSFRLRSKKTTTLHLCNVCQVSHSACQLLPEQVNKLSQACI